MEPIATMPTPMSAISSEVATHAAVKAGGVSIRARTWGRALRQCHAAVSRAAPGPAARCVVGGVVGRVVVWLGIGGHAPSMAGFGGRGWFGR